MSFITNPDSLTYTINSKRLLNASSFLSPASPQNNNNNNNTTTTTTTTTN